MAKLLACLFGMFVSLSAGQAPAGSDKLKDDKCSVEGRVVNSVTGAPLRRVTLTLTAAARVAGESGEDGRFAFQGLAPGRYRLVAQRTGYLVQGYGARSGSAIGGTALDLAAGQQVKDVLLKLVPEAVISGRVLDEDGEAAQNMEVAAFQSRYQRGARQWVRAGAATTNTLGEFRITSLSGGGYLVGTYLKNPGNVGPSAQPPGDKPEREYVLTFYPNATDQAGGVPVQVATGAEAGRTEIHLQRADTVRIRGKVTGAPEGKPAMVQLVPKGVADDGSISYWLGRRAMSQPQDGTFELKGVAPGTYMLSASYRDGQTQFSALTLLQVGRVHRDGLILQLVTAPELAGVVVTADKSSAKLNGVQVRAEPAEYAGMPVASATAGEDGKFTLKDVQLVLCRVQVSNLPGGAYVKSIRLGNQDVGQEGIDLSGGASDGLQITVSMAGAQVDGVVQSGESKPVSGATVVLVPESRRYSLFKEARTGEDGSFSFKGVTPGDYKLLAWEDIEPGAYQDPEFLKKYESKAESLSLKESGRRTLQVKVIPLEEQR
jgi:protocatechuate 3,4-dioxygenase beta subunit